MQSLYLKLYILVLKVSTLGSYEQTDNNRCKASLSILYVNRYLTLVIHCHSFSCVTSHCLIKSISGYSLVSCLPKPGPRVWAGLGLEILENIGLGPIPLGPGPGLGSKIRGWAWAGRTINLQWRAGPGMGFIIQPRAGLGLDF